MNLYKAKKRRRFLFGFIPSMLFISLPLAIAGSMNEKFATACIILAIIIPIIIGILLAKTAKE